MIGPPTGSITLVSSLREIPTVAVLHHAFLFGEKPMWLQATSVILLNSFMMLLKIIMREENERQMVNNVNCEEMRFVIRNLVDVEDPPGNGARNSF